MNKLIISIVCLFLFTNFSIGQRTLYVDNFSTILGSPNKEDKLLLFAKKNNFKTVILYQLNKVHKRWSLINPKENTVLSKFITKAKNKFSIKNIGASGESASFFTEIINIYNNSRNKPEEKFDIYNLEFEYWSKNATEPGGYYCENYLRDDSKPCTRGGSFLFFLENLKEIKALSINNIHNIKTETLLSFYSASEINNIVKYCDGITLQATGKNPRTSFLSVKKNIENLIKTKSSIKTSILFSARMNQMGYWLKSNSLERSEKKFLNELKINNLDLSKNINNFCYHTYSYLEKSVNYYQYTRN